jgi:hypothetical protein
MAAKRANLPVEFLVVEFTFSELQTAAAEVAPQFEEKVSVSVDEKRQSVVVAGASATEVNVVIDLAGRVRE